MVEQQTETAPRPRSVQKHWVGVDMYLEHSIGSDGEMRCQLYRRGGDGPPEPLLREPLIVLDFDPNRIKSAFRRGQDAAMAEMQGPPAQRRSAHSKGTPLTHHLNREEMVKALSSERKVTPTPKAKKSNSKRRKSQIRRLKYWARRYARVWDCW